MAAFSGNTDYTGQKAFCCDTDFIPWMFLNVINDQANGTELVIFIFRVLTSISLITSILLIRWKLPFWQVSSDVRWKWKLPLLQWGL